MNDRTGAVQSAGGDEGRSARRRRAILDAATELFLQRGYPGASMDDVAARASASKQTLYKYFASKEALFLAIVGNMTGEASDRVQRDIPDASDRAQIADYLLAYAERQLMVVLTPPLMQLRRLVIGEAERFPELGRMLHAAGPGRAIAGLAAAFARWGEQRLLAIEDPKVAAADFNWLVMGDPINRAMLLGDAVFADTDELKRHARNAVRVFLAAYAPPE